MFLFSNCVNKHKDTEINSFENINKVKNNGFEEIDAIKKNLNDTQNSQTNFQERDFASFLTKFKCDTTFQFERIKFPIKGSIDNEDYLWNKMDWIFYYYEDICLNILNKNNTYSESIQSINDYNKIWRFFIENSGYDTYFTFEFLNNRWMLVRYDYANY